MQSTLRLRDWQARSLAGRQGHEKFLPFCLCNTKEFTAVPHGQKKPGQPLLTDRVPPDRRGFWGGSIKSLIHHGVQIESFYFQFLFLVRCAAILVSYVQGLDVTHRRLV